VDELLAHVRVRGTLPWVYPMVAFAAYTGARRSEMLRALASDVDLAGGTVTIREQKRVRGRRSTRTAPITPKLAEALREWLARKPRHPSLFCQAEAVARSKTKRDGPTGLTPDEAHDHFKRTMADSKWEVLRGWHVLRHSFISALASEGVDQRVIDEIVGHQSEEQRKRYPPRRQVCHQCAAVRDGERKKTCRVVPG
jgi:integrase